MIMTKLENIYIFLGSTLKLVIGLNYVWGVVISAVISLLYTFAGGLRSVAYTDVAQLFGIFFGLVSIERFKYFFTTVLND